MVSEVSNSDRLNAKAFVSKVKLVAVDVSSKVKELGHVCNLVLDNWTDPVAVEEVDIESGTVPSDPAERPSKLLDRQRQFLIKSGPTQHRLAKYPKNYDIKKGKQSSFKSDWYSEYPHLEYSIKNDSVYCFVCSLFPEGPAKLNAEESWIKVGVRSWHKIKSRGKNKAGKLEQHFSSKAHNAALADFFQFSKAGDLLTIFDKET